MNLKHLFKNQFSWQAKKNIWLLVKSLQLRIIGADMLLPVCTEQLRMDIFCSAQSASWSRGSECFRQEGTQTKIAFISPSKINSAYVPLCVLDVLVFIRLCLFSRAGQITWLHTLTEPNTCFSHRPASSPRPSQLLFVRTSWSNWAPWRQQIPRFNICGTGGACVWNSDNYLRILG